MLLSAAGGDTSYLIVVAHHTIMDGWSMQIFLQEVMAFYRAERRGEPAGLAPLRARFAELVARDRAAWGGPEFRRQLESWRERLAGAPALLELPLDRPGRAAKTYAGELYQAGDVGLAAEQGARARSPPAHHLFRPGLRRLRGGALADAADAKTW